MVDRFFACVNLDVWMQDNLPDEAPARRTPAMVPVAAYVDKLRLEDPEDVRPF